MNPTSKKNILVLAALGAAALAAASYGAYWWHTGRFMQTTDDAYVGGDISAISSKVSGYIQQLAVQDNMAVKKGDLLIRIDDRDYRAALAKAAGEVAAQQAALADIQATRQLQQATIAGSAASLLAATAATEKLANDNRRYNALAASSAISAQIRDNASADYRRAHAEQEKAKADKTVAERQLAVLDARQQQILAALAQAQANLEMARLNLSYTDIRAPFDGVIGNRRAWSGSFVSSGTQLLSLVPAHGLWIDANFKENQLAHMRAGQPVTIQLSESAETIRLVVENPGTPIAAVHLPRLFDRFYRVDPSRQRKGEGSGIGLAIVKSIVSAHHGSVAVQSDLRSTRFIIVLPK